MNLMFTEIFSWYVMSYVVFLTLKADWCLQAFAIVRTVLKLFSLLWKVTLPVGKRSIIFLLLYLHILLHKVQEEGSCKLKLQQLLGS